MWPAGLRWHRVMPCGSRHQLTPPWGPVSLAAAFSPLSSLALGLPCSWADAGRGRAPPAPGSWRLTPQSHRANKSSRCPLPSGSLSVLALQAALAGASPHSPSSPPHPSPGEGLLDQSGRSFQACCQLCPCWRPGSGIGHHREPSWLPAPAQGTFQITTITRKAPLGPVLSPDSSSVAPGVAQPSQLALWFWWGLCLQE